MQKHWKLAIYQDFIIWFFEKDIQKKKIPKNFF